MTTPPVRPATRILGWSAIGLVGGGATLVSVAIILLALFILDALILDTTAVQTTYFTIVRQKGAVEGSGVNGVIFEMKDPAGQMSDIWLPSTARPGAKVRLRMGRTKLFHLARPLEAPVLCPDAGPCD